MELDTWIAGYLDFWDEKFGQFSTLENITRPKLDSNLFGNNDATLQPDRVPQWPRGISHLEYLSTVYSLAIRCPRQEPVVIFHLVGLLTEARKTSLLGLSLKQTAMSYVESLEPTIFQQANTLKSLRIIGPVIVFPGGRESSAVGSSQSPQIWSRLCDR